MEELNAIREERDNDKMYKRNAVLAAAKYGGVQSSLGFTGA